MTEFQPTINGPFLVDLPKIGTHVCVQVTRNATSGAELHVLNGTALERQTKVASVQHQSALTPVFA